MTSNANKKAVGYFLNRSLIKQIKIRAAHIGVRPAHLVEKVMSEYLNDDPPAALISDFLEEVEPESEDLGMINEYVKEGHSEHCARRIVWGDGECGCGKRAKKP